jgi:hypothetical protein
MKIRKHHFTFRGIGQGNLKYPACFEEVEGKYNISLLYYRFYIPKSKI